MHGTPSYPRVPCPSSSHTCSHLAFMGMQNLSPGLHIARCSDTRCWQMDDHTDCASPEDHVFLSSVISTATNCQYFPSEHI